MVDAKSLKFLNIDGINTRYYEAGAGQPLVLVHGGAFGAGSSLEIFAQNLEALESAFHVFALDKIGHGYSDNPQTDADYTIECMTRHVHKFILTLGLERVNLIGQSRGAFNSISICLDDPQLVRGVVLCNSASLVPGVEAIPAYTKRVRAAAPFETGTKEWARYRASVMSFSDSSITDEYVDDWLRIYHLPKSIDARGKMEKLAVAQFYPSVEIAKEREFNRIRNGELSVPTLIHWGKDDPSALLDPDGLAVFKLLSENSSQVSLHITNEAGHFAFKEKPAEFNSLVTGFFSSLS